jgi:hypothetical protein
MSMNAQRIERAFQVVSLASLWLAFASGWVFKHGLASAWSERGADLPDPTLIYLALADGWMALVLPSVCTVAFLWLFRSRSPHLNWVSTGLVLAGLLYGLFAQAAFVLPAYKLCGSVTGCLP